MATQGIVTVVQGGRVMAKVVAGDNGFNAMKVGQAIAKHLNVADPVLLMVVAKEKHFGCERCLTVVARHAVGTSKGARVSLHTANNEVIGDLQPDDCLYGMYCRTFEMPTFNPRWAHGTADKCVIVNLDTRKARYARYNGPKLGE